MSHYTNQRREHTKVVVAALFAMLSWVALTLILKNQLDPRENGVAANMPVSKTEDKGSIPFSPAT